MAYMLIQLQTFEFIFVRLPETMLCTTDTFDEETFQAPVMTYTVALGKMFRDHSLIT